MPPDPSAPHADDSKVYDLVVIGGGPAGIIATGTASMFDASVAIIDNHHELGGAGVNTGTVPSKTLRETSLALSGVRSRNLYGVDLSLRREATVGDFLTHERNVKAGFNSMISRRLEVQHAAIFYGLGEFIDPHTVRVCPRPPCTTHEAGESADAPSSDAPVLVRGKNFLIATGSSPVRPAMFPFDKFGVYDSDTILDLTQVPKTLAVIGAGTIGSEYACTFGVLGAKVHLIDGRDVLLPFMDHELTTRLESAMREHGIIFHWHQNVVGCEVDEQHPIRLTLSSGEVLEVDAVLVAAGRKSNTDQLNLSAAGVQVGERGILHVDEQYRTNVPHIYAAGDVIGFPALASTSMEQARRATRYALGLPVRTHASNLLPNGIYTIPELSAVGETEDALKKHNVPYVVGRACYRDSARGRIIGDDEGLLKLIFRRDDLRLVGVHVIGEQATELVHIGLMAMLANQTIDTFDEACFNFPTLGNLYKTAAFDAQRQLVDESRAQAASSQAGANSPGISEVYSAPLPDLC